MDFEQIKCPSCGAPMVQIEGQKVLRCEYCNAVYRQEDTSFKDEQEQIQLDMEREKAKAYKERLEWDNKEYKREKRRQQREERKNAGRARRSSCLGCSFAFIFVAVIFGSAAYRVYLDNEKEIHNAFESSVSSAEKQPKIIKSIDEIPKVKLDHINYDSMKARKNMYTALYGKWTEGESEIVGDYLVSYDNEPGNFVLSVVKTNYSEGDNEPVTLYTAFVTNHICLKDDGTTVQSHPEKNTEYVNNINDTTYLDPDDMIPSMVHGWKDLKTLYQECISYLEIPYHVSYTKDLYIPKSAEAISEKAEYIPSTGDPDDVEETVSEEEKDEQ